MLGWYCLKCTQTYTINDANTLQELDAIIIEHMRTHPDTSENVINWFKHLGFSRIMNASLN